MGKLRLIAFGLLLQGALPALGSRMSGEPGVVTYTPSASMGTVGTRVSTRADRVVMAEGLRKSFVGEGRSIRIKAEGKDGRILTVRWPLMESPFVYRFTSDDRTIKKLQDAGFSRIHFANGERFWEQELE